MSTGILNKQGSGSGGTAVSLDENKLSGLLSGPFKTGERPLDNY